jgi:hypothetical protein
MNSFDERPEVLEHLLGKYSYSTKIAVDDIVFHLYGRKMGKATGIDHAAILCQDTGIWIATMDSIMVKVEDGKSLQRMTFGYVALKSDGEAVAMCLSHNHLNGSNAIDGDDHFPHIFIANDNCSILEFSEINLSDLGLSTTLQQLDIQRFGDVSNPADDSNPVLMPFKHAEERAKESCRRQQVETTKALSAAATVTKQFLKFVCPLSPSIDAESCRDRS